MKQHTSSLTKEERRQAISDYALRIWLDEDRLVTKREIRKELHCEIYNYFDGIYDLYGHLGLEVPLEYCPKWYAQMRIINFVREKSWEGLYPLHYEVVKELGIRISTYFKDIEHLYEVAGIDFELYKERKESIEHPYHSEELIKKTKKRIIAHIREKDKEGFFIGATDIQRDLQIAFYRYFNSCEEAYKAAHVKYGRDSPTILGKRKEEVFTKIVQELLQKMDYTIQRVSIFDDEFRNKGADLEIRNKHGEIILVELKAYRDDYCVTKREQKQLMNYMKQQNVKRGLFITTSTNVKKFYDEIEIISSNKLIDLLKKHKMQNKLKKIKWIQKKRVNRRDDFEKKKKKIQEIIHFVSENKNLKIGEIEKAMKIDLRTYLGNNRTKVIKNIQEGASIDSVLAYKVLRQQLLCKQLVQESTL